MNYSEKLKDPRWQDRRYEILERDSFTCRRCFDDDSTLQVHHLQYLKNHEPWDYEDRDLITLCLFCHEVVGIYKIPEAAINNPWLSYEYEKRKIPIEFSPREYTDRILEMSQDLSI